MAAYQGRLGLVEIGATASGVEVTEVTNFNYTTDAEEIPVSAYQDVAKRYLAGLQDAGRPVLVQSDDIPAVAFEFKLMGRRA